MAQATFCFHGELAHFLPYRRRGVVFSHSFDHHASVKDMIESLGVPHPEIDVIIVNGECVDFNYLVRDGDELHIYPLTADLDIQPQIHLCPEPPPGELRFVLDTHLGKLASHLRMLGFDTLYSNRFEDDELAEISSRENRILLTRDLGVLKRGIVTYGYYVRNTNPEKQLIEILQRYNLTPAIKPFKRCISCNGPLHPVEKSAVIDQLPPNVTGNHDSFHQCERCSKLYWKGSHHDRMQAFIQRVLNIPIP